ncbi:hypothetical protein G6F40_014248 [Rhizopus arrhizus]|nr:hypothetical protein G6F40_014248 [Rhizopus arrhizus]
MLDADQEVARLGRIQHGAQHLAISAVEADDHAWRSVVADQYGKFEIAACDEAGQQVEPERRHQRAIGRIAHQREHQRLVDVDVAATEHRLQQQAQRGQHLAQRHVAVAGLAQALLQVGHRGVLEEILEAAVVVTRVGAGAETGIGQLCQRLCCVAVLVGLACEPGQARPSVGHRQRTAADERQRLRRIQAQRRQQREAPLGRVAAGQEWISGASS